MSDWWNQPSTRPDDAPPAGRACPWCGVVADGVLGGMAGKMAVAAAIAASDSPESGGAGEPIDWTI